MQHSFDIFLSYSTADRLVVSSFCEDLKRQGVAVWRDEEQLEPGDSIIGKLQEGLRQSQFLVICLSPHFKNSNWCRAELASFLHKEIRERSNRILPVYVEHCNPEDCPEFLFDKYAVDVRTEEGFSRLLRKVKASSDESGRASESGHLSAFAIPPSLSEVEAANLDALVQLWFPHSISRSFFDLTQEQDELNRMRLTEICAENVLSFLIVILLAHQRARVAEFQPLLQGLHRRGLNERVQLLFQLLCSFRGASPKASAQPLLKWGVGEGGGPGAPLVAFLELSLIIQAGEQRGLSAKRGESLLRRLLSSLTWLQSYRLISLDEVDRAHPSLVRGKKRVLLGVVKRFLSESFCWSVSPESRLEQGCYLMVHDGAEVLKLSPYCLTCDELGEGIEGARQNEIWTFCGFEGEQIVVVGTNGEQLKISAENVEQMSSEEEGAIGIRAVADRPSLDSEEDSVQEDEPVADFAETFTDPDGCRLDFSALMTRVQRGLLGVGAGRLASDNALVVLDEISSGLSEAVERFPEQVENIQEAVVEWLRIVDQFLDDNKSDDSRRLLLGRRRDLEVLLQDALGGFSRSQILFMDGVRFDSPSPYSFSGIGPDDFEMGIKLFRVGDELDRSDCLQWLLGRGLEEAERLLRRSAEEGVVSVVSPVLWRRLVRVFLYYRDVFWGLIKLLRQIDYDFWGARLDRFVHVLERGLQVDEAQELLLACEPADASVLASFLAMHSNSKLRQVGFSNLKPEDRWELLLAPSMHSLILREIVELSCRDCSPSYIKSMFLLLRPRLRSAETPLAFSHAVEIVKVFYQIPLFLEATFFKALIGLQSEMNRKALNIDGLAEVAKNFDSYFDEFRKRIAHRDSGLTELRGIPLPIQRKLAHDGYFTEVFICSSRDPIALETVPYALRRADVTKFFRLSSINGSALARLAAHDKTMREPVNRMIFCRNPKAHPKQVKKYLPQLSLEQIRLIAQDLNASDHARQFARQVLKNRSVPVK